MMEYLVLTIFLFVAVAGLISIMFGLPGNFIILAGSILYGWYDGFKEITTKVIILLVVLAVLGEVLEFILGIAGAKRQKASKSAIIGSILGGIVGAIVGASFLLGIGSIIGAFVGAFAGAFLAEFLRGKGLNQALQSGRGAFWGRVFGTITKGAIGIAMIAIAVVSVVRN
jgi:uncharacterized protein YqgC (DUF456 family)